MCEPGYKPIYEYVNPDPNSVLNTENLINTKNKLLDGANNILNSYTGKSNNDDNNSDKINEQNKKINEQNLIKLKNQYEKLPKYKILNDFLDNFIKNYDLYSDSHQAQYNYNIYNNRDNSDNDDYTDNKNYYKILNLLSQLQSYRNKKYENVIIERYRNDILKNLLSKLYYNSNKNRNYYGGGDNLNNDELTEKLKKSEEEKNKLIQENEKLKKSEEEKNKLIQENEKLKNITKVSDDKPVIQTEKNMNIQEINDAYNGITSLEIKNNKIIIEFVKKYKNKIINKYNDRNRFRNQWYGRNRDDEDDDEDITNNPQMIFLLDIQNFKNLDELIQFILNKLIGNDNSTIKKTTKNISNYLNKLKSKFFGGKSMRYKSKTSKNNNKYKNKTKKCNKK